jgi:3-hydroxy-5-methyl-1-naphthoate 3-O-methyltransferase
VASSASAQPSRLSPAHAIWQLSSGFFMSSRVVQTAWGLGVFERLASGPQAATALAHEVGADPAGLEALLVACTALGMLERASDGRYRNTAMAESIHASAPLGAVVEDAVGLYRDWLALPDAIRRGSARTSPAYEEPNAVRAYLEGVAATSAPEAARLVETHDFGEVRHVLDVGGGSGTYAIALCRRWPTLRVDLVERPAVAPIANELIAAAGLGQRIQVHADDYRVATWQADYDLVLLMNVLHQEAEPDAQALVGRAARALTVGGCIVVQDLCLGPTSSGPAMAALLGVNLYLRQSGRVHAISSVNGWLEVQGLVVSERTQHPQTGFATLVATRDHPREA